jgi:hypothetical protein
VSEVSEDDEGSEEVDLFDSIFMFIQYDHLYDAYMDSEREISGKERY